MKSKNRIRNDRDLKAGMVLNLQEHRKRGDEIPVVKISNTAPAKPAVVTTTPVPTSTQPAVTNSTKNTTISSSTRISHTVATGETLFAISKKYGVTVNQLKEWNNIGTQNIISIGQKLVIFKP